MRSLVVLTLTLLAGLALVACGPTSLPSLGGLAQPSPALKALPAATATTPPLALPTTPLPDPPPAMVTSTNAAIPPGPVTPTAPVGGTTPAQVGTFVLVPAETTASYSIDEAFIDQGNILTTAVGKTTAVEGRFRLNYADPAASTFELFVVDLSTLSSDSPRRDQAIRSRWLESAHYRLATFKVTEVRNFPVNSRPGRPVQFQLLGDMTIKEITRPVTWDITASLTGDRLTGTATTLIKLADYNIPVPSIAGILTVKDGVTVTVNFTFQEAGE